MAKGSFLTPVKARSLNSNLEEGSDRENSSSRERAAGNELATYRPIHWPPLKRYAIVLIYSALEAVILLQQPLYQDGERLVARKFAVKSSQVLALGVSMNIIGNTIGVAVLGPLSDVYGRKWIYVVSTFLYAILNFGTTYARNFPMLVIFLFLSGIAGATSLTNVAATISDLFGDSDSAGQPMALWVAGSSIGPTLGGLAGVWITKAGLGLKWLFLLNVILGFGFAVIVAFVPETLPRLVVAKKLGKTASVDQGFAQAVGATESESQDSNNRTVYGLGQALSNSFRLLFTQPIILFTGIFNGVANGVLLLFVTGIVTDYLTLKHLTLQQATNNSIVFIVAVVILVLFIPLQTYLYRRDRIRHNGFNRPEARLLTPLALIWLFPIGAFWAAFTSGSGFSRWNQIVAGGLVGFTDSLLYLSLLNYIIDTYPYTAGSATAAFLIPSFIIQAALAHLGSLLYEHVALKWALAMQGFFALGLVVPGTYFTYFAGPKMRAVSSLARKPE